MQGPLAGLPAGPAGSSAAGAAALRERKPVLQTSLLQPNGQPMRHVLRDADLFRLFAAGLPGPAGEPQARRALRTAE